MGVDGEKLCALSFSFLLEIHFPSSVSSEEGKCGLMWLEYLCMTSMSFSLVAQLQQVVQALVFIFAIFQHSI